MNNATVFSQPYTIAFEKPTDKAEVEARFEKFILAVGQALSYNEVILGHIKILASLCNEEYYLFLSLTRLDRVDRKISPAWQNEDRAIESLNVRINVLVFGYSLSTVKKIVDDYFQMLSCGDR